MPWILTKDRETLECHTAYGETTVGGNPIYYIPLESCHSSAAVLNWIVQVANKEWCDPECLRDLVMALDGRFELQSKFCSFGIERKLKISKMPKVSNS